MEEIMKQEEITGMDETTVFLLALQAGIVEETIFSIFPITFAMRHRENRKMIMYSVFC